MNFAIGKARDGEPGRANRAAARAPPRNACCGCENPTSGIGRFGGKDIARLSTPERKWFRRSVQAVFQDPFSSLNPRMRVQDILGEPLVVHETHSGQALDDAGWASCCRWWAFPPTRRALYPHEFSGGQRQRIAIARALALDPQLVVLDEPVSALDVSVRAQVTNLLQDLQEKLGLSYLLIAHDLAMVQHMSNTICVMYLGKIVEVTQEPGAAPRIRCIPTRRPSTRRRCRTIRRIRATRSCCGGEVPSPLNPPSGCRFHTRCPSAMPRCSRSRAAAAGSRAASPGGVPPVLKRIGERIPMTRSHRQPSARTREAAARRCSRDRRLAHRRRTVLRDDPGRLRRRRHQGRAAGQRRPIAGRRTLHHHGGRRASADSSRPSIATGAASPSTSSPPPARSSSAGSRRKSDCARREFLARARMDRLGLGYTALREVNPRLVYAAISGFGQLAPYIGPWSSRPANNATSQAMSGLMELSGDVDGPPAFIGQAIGDTIPGLWAVIAILMALEDRRRTGRGQFIDVAMYDSLAAMCANAITDYHVTGVAPRRGASWHETFSARLPCADGYIAVSLWGTVPGALASAVAADRARGHALAPGVRPGAPRMSALLSRREVGALSTGSSARRARMRSSFSSISASARGRCRRSRKSTRASSCGCATCSSSSTTGWAARSGRSARR